LTLIREGVISERIYQNNIAETASRQSTLVVLPTGMGKTVIALIVADRVLERGGRVLMMAPTKPLAEQHFTFMREKLRLEEGIVLMTGENEPSHRYAAWLTSPLIIATPQVVENDIESGHANIDAFNLLIFDECHRATGDYAYVHIARRYNQGKGDKMVLGMTASPGSEMQQVEEICRTLGIARIEARTLEDPDVSPYAQYTAVRWVRVKVSPELKETTILIREMLASRIRALKKLEFLPEDFSGTTTELLGAGRRISDEIEEGRKSRQLFEALSVHSEAMKLVHALDLAETQSVFALRKYVEKIEEEGVVRHSKASVSVLKDPLFPLIVEKIRALKGEHPKMRRLAEVVIDQLSQKTDSRIIVFAQYRDTAEVILQQLSEIEGVRPVKLIGQGRRGEERGLKQSEQMDVIARFSRGEYNVLISTSVGEEGLDIVQTNLVIFYEPVPSEIRTIQRKGRTGRISAGRVVILIAEETKDEGFYYSSMRKERAMKQALLRLNARLQGDMPEGYAAEQKTLSEF